MQGATARRSLDSPVWRGKKRGRLPALQYRRRRTGENALTILKCVNHYGGGLYIMPHYRGWGCLCCRQHLQVMTIMYLSVSERLEVRLTLLLCFPVVFASLLLVLSASLSLVLSSSFLSLVLSFCCLFFASVLCLLSFSSSS